MTDKDNVATGDAGRLFGPRKLNIRIATGVSRGHMLTLLFGSFFGIAMMGFINIEQSAITKMFSIVAVVFLPPTLVASIYGMNFEVMPELAQPFGYPLAIGAMVISAILPLWYFKRRGWF